MTTQRERSADTQQRILIAIRCYQSKWGFSPTLREIADMTELKTPSAVRHQLDRLRAAGLVDWRDGASRTLRLTGKAAQS